MNQEKIETRHQKLAAYVYIRQSTGHQVRHHHQGRERQYELAQRARELGFAKVVVIDDDQGKTGSGAVERTGFASLLAAVCAGEVGAVFALEASRLARNNLDWHHLIDLCGLVAGELEARWNVALQRVADIQQQLSELEAARHVVTAEEKQRLLALGRDLPALWNHPEAADDLKKRILRTVLEEIIIGDNADRTLHVLRMHWKGGVHTELQIRRSSRGQKVQVTDKTALELIEELSKVCSDQAIAATLNRLGYKTGAAKTWRVHSVHNARYIHRLTNHRKQQAWVTVQQAASELGVSQTVIRRLIEQQTLPATQVIATTPWIIERTALSLPDVQSEITAVQAGRQLSRHDPHQQELPFK